MRMLCCSLAGHQTLLLDCHLNDISTDQACDVIARFGADMTVVTTAPTYLFWRCAPPELRVPAHFLRTLGRRGGRTVSGRAAWIGNTGARRCANWVWTPWFWANVNMSSPRWRKRRDWSRIPSLAIRDDDAVTITGGPAASAFTHLPPCAGPTPGWPGISITIIASTNRFAGPGRGSRGIARLPLQL